MPDYKNYRKKNVQPMRPYIPGEPIDGVSVSDGDILEVGGMIARNQNNHDDLWYVSKSFFQANYELAE